MTILIKHYNIIDYFDQCFKTRTGDRPSQGIWSLGHWSNQWVTGWTA